MTEAEMREEERRVAAIAPKRTLPHPEAVEAILRDRENDGLRLAYAQTLTRAGDPLGLFIEGSVKAAQGRSRDGAVAVPEPGDSPDPRDFLPERLFRAVNCPTFRRGFVEYAELYAAELPGRVPDLFRAFPLLRRLAVYRNEGRKERRGFRGLIDLLAADEFARVQSLWLPWCWEGQGDSLAFILARLSTVSGLCEITLSSSGITQDGIWALLTSAHLLALNSLDIHSSELSRDDVLPIAQFGDRLESLDLGRATLTAWSVETLCASSTLQRLRTLRLSSNEIGERGGEAIATTAAFPALEFLEVADQSPRTIVALATSRTLPKLRTLFVSCGKPGPEIGGALAAATPSHPLHVLNLYGALIGDKGVKELCGSQFLTGAEVRELNLGENDISDRGAASMAGSSNLRGLRRVQLYRNRITERGRELLRTSENLAQVTFDFDG